uniref:Uncharacterized protein n=1 Tax=Oryza glaberrima TaxID=4538 RepID=I1R700_ORYGL
CQSNSLLFFLLSPLLPSLRLSILSSLQATERQRRSGMQRPIGFAMAASPHQVVAPPQAQTGASPACASSTTPSSTVATSSPTPPINLFTPTKRLRYLARFLLVALLLTRRADTVPRLATHICTLLDGSKKTLQEAEYKEWKHVVQEMEKMRPATTTAAEMEKSGHRPSLSCVRSPVGQGTRLALLPDGRRSPPFSPMAAGGRRGSGARWRRRERRERRAAASAGEEGATRGGAGREKLLSVAWREERRGERDEEREDGGRGGRRGIRGIAEQEWLSHPTKNFITAFFRNLMLVTTSKTIFMDSSEIINANSLLTIISMRVRDYRSEQQQGATRSTSCCAMNRTFISNNGRNGLQLQIYIYIYHNAKAKLEFFSTFQNSKPTHNDSKPRTAGVNQAGRGNI